MTARWPLALTAAALAVLGLPTLVDLAPRLVWNASASAPLGLYWVERRPPTRGELALAELPPDARDLAATRGYLPLGVRLVKPVAGVAGDVVCATGGRVHVNGRTVAERLAHDRRGRPLPAWEACRPLGSDEIFLLMEGVADSFDGRYFGPVSRSAVIGKLTPLWTFRVDWSVEEGGGPVSKIKEEPGTGAQVVVCTSGSLPARANAGRERAEKFWTGKAICSRDDAPSVSQGTEP